MEGVGEPCVPSQGLREWPECPPQHPKGEEGWAGAGGDIRADGWAFGPRVAKGICWGGSEVRFTAERRALEALMGSGGQGFCSPGQLGIGGEASRCEC